MQGEPRVLRGAVPEGTCHEADAHRGGGTCGVLAHRAGLDSFHSMAGAAPDSLTRVGGGRREGGDDQHPEVLNAAAAGGDQELGHHHISTERRHCGGVTRVQPQPPHGDRLRADRHESGVCDGRVRERDGAGVHPSQIQRDMCGGGGEGHERAGVFPTCQCPTV